MQNNCINNFEIKYIKSIYLCVYSSLQCNMILQKSFWFADLLLKKHFLLLSMMKNFLYYQWWNISYYYQWWNIFYITNDETFLIIINDETFLILSMMKHSCYYQWWTFFFIIIIDRHKVKNQKPKKHFYFIYLVI